MADNTLNVLPGSTDFEKLEYLCKRTFKAQAVWFLNATWNTIGQQEAENLWNYVHKAQEIDIDHKEQGTHLDELQAHRLLESFDETMTVREMRTYLRQHGAIGDRVKSVPLTHWWIAKYGEDWEKLVNASQGDNKEELEEAQRRLDAVQAAFEAAAQRAKEAAAAVQEAKQREAEAHAAADLAKQREAESHAAKAELEAALAELKAQEDAYNNKTQELKQKSEEGGVVSRNRAKAAKAQVARDREADAHAAEAPFKAAQEELEAALAEMKAQEDAYNNKTAQLKQQSEEGGVVSRNRAKVQLDAHLAEDPLPLRRAKLTTEAARKKAEKARAPFEAATQIAVAARAEADAAVEEAARLVADAEAFLEEVRNRPGSAKGTFWWMDRELTTQELKQQSEEGGVVSRNRAKVQLDAHLAEDPLPLRRAKITQEAAVKKAERATKAAAEATAASEAAAAEAAKATQRSLDAKQAAEDAVQAAHVEVKAAEDYLQEVKSKPGQAFGAIWWIERELIEAKKYMPTSKGGIAK
eukprot:CAMPEP_0174246722 /NCGR_PEP_ID=MMETSP0417-20130205/42214_1 /TAXON_ID=242541 /ORGANISM="Mayorella sp, Strain BSH-02190019" /LENGTH=525 /DNA_ID=CAMNT_0015326575 /DNA_START=77 /DNA_END=1654 /DNA_ORIENTATION=-